MSITIKKEKAPNLVKVDMNCDGCLSEKLNNFELLKHLNKHATVLFCGKPGSGKTNLITSLFKSKDCLRKVYHRVYLFQPESSGASIKNNIFDKLPEQQRFDELNYENLEYVYNDIKGMEKNQNKCIILDDCAAALKDKQLQKIFKLLNNNRRHLGLSIYFLSQTYFSIARELRRVFSDLFIFKTSKMELQTIFEEQIELDKSYVLPLSNLVFNEKFNFLFINTDSQQLFRNFDRIILNKEGDEM